MFKILLVLATTLALTTALQTLLRRRSATAKNDPANEHARARQLDPCRGLTHWGKDDFTLGTKVDSVKDIVLVVGEGGTFLAQVAGLAAAAGERVIAGSGGSLYGIPANGAADEWLSSTTEAAQISSTLTKVVAC